MKHASLPQLNWSSHLAAVWRGRHQTLKPVVDLDEITFQDLVGIPKQKEAFCRNLERFLTQKPANHTLLWGHRGSGKSSLVKAALNAYGAQGLRVVEIEKEDIHDLPDIVDQLREQPWRFLVYCDDLTFEVGDTRYRHMKVLMEGSIEKPPDNMLMIATSNRRHLTPQYQKDNEAALAFTEVNPREAIDNGISLSDRFGLQLSFYAPDQTVFLEMVDALFAPYEGNGEDVHKAALAFAHERGGRSGRVARQFYNQYREGSTSE